MSVLAVAHGLHRTDGILIGAIVVLLLGSSFLAMSETALTRMSRVKAMSLLETRRRGSGALLRLIEHPERFLNPILLLNNLCQLVAATLIAIVADHLFGALGVVVATAVEVAVVFAVGEAAPKTWAIQHTERASLLAAPIMTAVLAFPPLRFTTNALIRISNLVLPGKGLKRGPFVSEQELLAMADVAAEEDVIEVEERALIRRIIEFGDTVVRAVMVPRTDMVAVGSGEHVNEVIERAIDAGYSRIPVFDNGIDDVAGIVYTKDLMRAAREGNGEQAVSTLARPAHFVPETKRVAELMREMQKEKFHIAIAVDEYGGTAGLVTLEDLIEELVGEIVDEFDVEEPSMEPLPGGALRVDARMAIGELNDLLHTEMPAGDWDTVGGLVFNLLGHVPVEGESVEADGHRLVAEKIQGRRIGRVRIVPLPAEERAESADPVR